MIPRVQLGESAVAALLRNKTAVKEFPFLLDAPKIKKKGCGGCGAKLTAVSDTNWIKRRVAALGKADKERIKILLNAKQVVGHYREDGRLKNFAF